MTPSAMDGSVTTIHGRVGPGLIEISALSTLIGSRTAASLCLGDRGAAGLAWAGMSMFGFLSIIQACVAATAPSWLRESLGVRSSATDFSVGMSLDLSTKNTSRDDAARKNQLEAVGIMREIQINSKRTSSCPTTHTSPRDVYAFDRFTSATLDNIPYLKPGEGIHVNVFGRDPHYRDPIVNRDWFSLACSLVKIVEMITLWSIHGRDICWVTGCPWLYFFICAVILQQQKLSRGTTQNPEGRQVDIIAGTLPTSRRVGEECKILLQAPRNFRHHLLWKMMWAGGTLVTTSCLVAVYVLLVTQEAQIIYTWLGFQTLWLITRSAYFHLSQEDGTMRNPMVSRHSLETMSQDSRRRLFELILAISMFQIHNHPRGTYSYEEDLLTYNDLEASSQLIRSGLQPHIDIALIGKDASITELSFITVIGDTFLSSAAWLNGSNATGLDLYDSCIVILRIAGTSFAVPSARVVCSVSRNINGVEDGQLSLNPPRGTFNWGPDSIKWVYWIPCSDSRWLQVCTEKLKIKGIRKADLVTDKEITQQLSTGAINVSHCHVDGIREVVELSKVMATMLQGLLGKHE